MSGVRGARELFVWYRVEGHLAERAHAEVIAMQRTLEARCPGLHARLLIRDDGSGPQTWMETYASTEATTHPHGIDDSTQALIETAAVPIRRWLDGNRHVEGFERVDRF